jgi:TPR repeat protein
VIATVHRDLGRIRRAFEWWQKAAAAGDGGAFVDLGYCLYYGLGVRRDAAKALIAFRRAGRQTNISEWEREEAHYHRAVAHLDRGDRGDIARARGLLTRANVDDDYVEARSLLAQLDEKARILPCRCRRGLNRDVAGQAPCVPHGRRASTTQASVLKGRVEQRGLSPRHNGF